MNRILLALFTLCWHISGFSQAIQLTISEDGALFMQNADSIMFYQAANKSLNGSYQRCNYIHPLYTIDGAVLTEHFPEDHPHQRGIFWAWHQWYVGEQKMGDGWDITDISWQVVSLAEKNTYDASRSLVASVQWFSPLWVDEAKNETPLVNEITTITVYPSEKSFRFIDIEIVLLALKPEMRLGGSDDEKGYGGFSARVQLADDTRFFGPKGKVEPQNLPVDAGAWIDVVGSVGRNNVLAGMAIFCHPENPGFPNPWILRQARSMQNAVYPYPGRIPVRLSDTEPLVLRYRLVIHNADESLDMSKLYQNYLEN